MDGDLFNATIYKKQDEYYLKNEYNQIAKIYTTVPYEICQQLRFFSEQLSHMINTHIKGTSFYRNTIPSLNNIVGCFNNIASDASLMGHIDAVSANGMGAHRQPTSVFSTLKLALDQNVHGGVFQSYLAMKKEHEFNDFVLLLDKIFPFIKLLVVF